MSYSRETIAFFSKLSSVPILIGRVSMIHLHIWPKAQSTPACMRVLSTSVRTIPGPSTSISFSYGYFYAVLRPTTSEKSKIFRKEPRKSKGRSGTRSSRPRRSEGKLSRLMDMPMDIFLEVTHIVCIVVDTIGLSLQTDHGVATPSRLTEPCSRFTTLSCDFDESLLQRNVDGCQKECPGYATAS